MFKNKVLLITGGTGSFGSAVLDRFLESDIKEIRIFSRDEKKQYDLRVKYQNPKLKFYIGDVRDYHSINDAVKGVDYVFCAAALKQVPSCEFYPLEAVKTNILGTENTLRAAIENNVKKVVVLSTDKAVYPINVMGMSKALMEKVTIAASRQVSSDGPIMCNTRYGNVMASRGSVIPLFVEQIKSGKALTVTDPEMTRFMMSLEDAVELVLFAFENGRQGDTFVQKSPATTVGILVKALLKIFSASNEVKIIGTRHGEKKHETLLSREEMGKVNNYEKYFGVPADNRDLNYEKYFVEGAAKLSEITDYTSASTEQLNLEQVIELLMGLDYIRDQLREWEQK